MRRALRLVNLLIAVVTLASALAVLGSDLLEPGYHEAHHDVLPFVVTYAALQVGIIVAFARDTWLVPWLAVGKAVAAWVFLATFALVGPAWMAGTPGRYVYQLFDWGEGAELLRVGMVYLGRGAWNTFNAFYFTSPWWQPLRLRRPLLGRAVTAVPIGVIALCFWMFVELARVAHAHALARLVYDGLDCEVIRAHAGETTTDVREQGKRRYIVRIVYGCALTRVLVGDEQGRIGTVAGPRTDCCPAGS